MTEENNLTPKRPFRKTFIANLLVIIGICVLLYFLFFASLGWITGHGQEKVVPKLIGQNYNTIASSLSKAGFDVDIDSTYDPSIPPLTIVQQQPEAGMTVKAGRTIFITINKVNAPKTPMPNLINLSFRSAEIVLKNNKLLLGDTSYRPDIANGSILEQTLANGQAIAPGTLIAQGTKINLVIGSSLDLQEIPVPNLIGMTYPEAINLINNSNLQYNANFTGAISDTNTAVIYLQNPGSQASDSTQNYIQEGDMIDISIMQNMPQQ